MANYTFDATIPATNNDPSEDQPKMLNNNVSNQAIWEVDHIGFNANESGEHKAISFNQDASYVPVAFPVDTPKLFTNTVSGLAQLFYYSGSQSQSENQYTVGTNASTFLLGGLIVKTGMVTMTGATTAFTYAALSPALEPFINDTISVLLSPANAQGALVGVTQPYVSSKNAAGFTVTSNLLAGSILYFFAVGY